MTSSTLPTPRLPGAVIALTALWLGLAVIAGTTGFLVRLSYPGPQLLIVSLFIATLAAATSVPAVRAWVDAVPIRALIGFNALRFIGIAFIVMGARGTISPAFAGRAGWGDAVTAALAVGLVLAGAPATSPRRALAHAWNVFGFLDLVVAVATATWVTLNGITPGVGPVLSWPLSVVPLFFVPILLANHILIARRLWAAGGGPREGGRGGPAAPERGGDLTRDADSRQLSLRERRDGFPTGGTASGGGRPPRS